MQVWFDLGEIEWALHHSQLFIIKDSEQLLHQSVTGQRLVIDDVGKVLLALQQLLPWSVQQRIT